MKKEKRQSNIELLRILTMCGVVILHYNNEEIGGGLAYASGVNLYILYFGESVFICAVNLFVLAQQKGMVIKMKEQNIEELIYAETEKRLDTMGKPEYAFPEQINKTDWILIGSGIAVSLILIVLCMVGVIV